MDPGLRGQPSVVKASMKMGGYNILSFITARGKMLHSLKEGNIDGEVFIEFLKHLILNRDRPLILLGDHATFHGSKLVRDFVVRIEPT